MNILRCPKCGGELIINMLFTTHYRKKMFLTSDGWDDAADNIMDEPPIEPIRSLGAACCSSCGAEWRRPFYEIGIDDQRLVCFIVLSHDEVKMSIEDRKKYFADEGIEIVYR